MDPDLKARIDALQHADVSTRLAAAEALAQDPQPLAAAALLGALADSDDEVRQWAAEALENLGAPQKSQLDELTAFARSDNDDAAYWALTLLGRLGRDAAAAKPLLDELAERGRSPAVCKRARWALDRLV